MSASHVVSDNGAVQVAGDLRLREPVTRGIARGEGANSASPEASLKRMLGTPPGPLVIAERAAVVDGHALLTATTANPTAPAGVAKTNVFGVPAVPIAAKADACNDVGSGAPNFVKAGDAVLEVPNIGNYVSQVAYWPGSANDLVVLSVVSAGTEMGGETTRSCVGRATGDGCPIAGSRRHSRRKLMILSVTRAKSRRCRSAFRRATSHYST